MKKVPKHYKKPVTAKQRRALKQLYAPDPVEERGRRFGIANGVPLWKIGPPVLRPRQGEDPRMSLSLPKRNVEHGYRVALEGADVLLTNCRHVALQRFMGALKWDLGKAQIFCDGVEYPLLELKRMP